MSDRGRGPAAPNARAARPRDRRDTRDAPAPREVELKYLVRDVEALRAWLARGWGGAPRRRRRPARAQIVEVEDRYLDTAYGALEQAGFGGPPAARGRRAR